MPQAQTQQFLFDFALFRDAAEDIQKIYPPENYRKLALSKRDLLFVSHHDTLSIHQSESGATHYFIGAVFLFNEQSPKKSDGHFVCVSVQPQGQIEIFRNQSSPLGVYYFSQSHVLGVVSVLHRNRKALSSRFQFSLSEESLADFLIHGFVSFGFTPYNHLFQLPFRYILSLNNTDFKLIPEETTPARPLCSDQDLFNMIQDRFSLWWKHAPFQSCAISGGIDSRMVLAPLLTRGIQRQVPLHSRLHPQLDPHTDRDVFIAQQVASLVGQKHDIQPTRTAPPTYFLRQSPPAKPPVLSGLYGGEFLGGEMLNLVELSNIEKPDLPPTRFAEIVCEKKSLSARDEEVDLKLQVLAQSSLCNLYRGAWFMVSVHHNFTYTPFWDTQLIQYISQLTSEDLKNYRLYRRLYEYLPTALREIPLNSQITHYYPELNTCTTGQDPKTPGLIRNFDVKPISPHTKDFIPSRLRHTALTNTNVAALQNFLTSTGFLES